MGAGGLMEATLVVNQGLVCMPSPRRCSWLTPSPRWPSQPFNGPHLRSIR